LFAGVTQAESIVEVLQRQVKEAEAAAAPRVVSLSSLSLSDAAALRASLEQLAKTQAAAEPRSPEELREQLHGFWRLLFTSSPARAKNGVTGYGEGPSRALLAQFQCFKPDAAGGDALSLQTVEVVSDAREGRAAVAAGKGEFHVGKDGSGVLGVMEGFHKLEVDGELLRATLPSPVRWSPAFLDQGFRISKEEDGTFSVYSKVEPAETQAAIARLAETPVEVVQEEGADAVDDRPIWQQRYESDRWGETEAGSDIP